MHRISTIRTIILSCICLILTALNIAQAADKDTLVMGMVQKPRHLNPAVQSGIATAMPGTQLFATPIRMDEQWQAHPYLAERWEVAGDGKSITLHLRKNALFHDGKPITSEDVAFSVNTVRDNHPFKTMYAPVEAVETPDSHTAILKFKQAHPAALLAMSSALLPIIPKHVYGDGQDVKTHPANSKPIGSGPFKLVEFVPGQHIVLERFDDYFLKDAPKLKRLIYKQYKDGTSMALALDKGELDMAAFMTGSRNLKRLKKNKNLVVTREGYAAVGAVNWLAFNLKNDYLKHKAVRQAIAYSTDQNFIVKALLAGFAAPANAPIVSGSPFAAPDVEKYAVDLDKANQLLDEAGFPVKGKHRFQLTIDYMPGFTEVQKNIAEYLRTQLKKVSIDVKLRSSPDFPTWARYVSGHDFDMTMDVVFNWGDPMIGVHRTYLCSNIRKGVIWSNTQNYCNEEVDTLLNKAGIEQDPKMRTNLYQQAQHKIVDDAPLVFLNEMPYHTIYRKNIVSPPLTIWGAMAPMDRVEKQ